MAYSFQSFSVGQVLTAAQMNQTEVNVRDHSHGESGVNAVHGSMTILGSGLAVGSVAPAGLGTVNVKAGFYVDGVQHGVFRGALLVLQSNQMTEPSVQTPLIFSSSAVNYDTSSIFNPASNTLMKIPPGYTKARITFQAGFDSAISGATTIALRVGKNGSANFPGGMNESTPINSGQAVTLNACTGVLNVAPGDLFTVIPFHTVNTLNILSGPDWTWAAIEIFP